MNTYALSNRYKPSRRDQALAMIIVIMFAMAINLTSGIVDTHLTMMKQMENSSKSFTALFSNCTESFCESNTDITVSVMEEYNQFVEDQKWKGPVLTKSRGTITGPSGKETFYNLNMTYVVRNMQRAGYDYEYWVRSDGVKMFGNYVMVAANLSIRPKGTIIMTSLGPGIVCDTGTFAKRNPTQIDIATSW